MTKEKIWDYIIENQIATEEELKLITCINGYKEEALNAVIYARTGYHDKAEGQSKTAIPVFEFLKEKLDKEV